MGAYVMVKLVQHCMPIILRILGLLNKRLMPIARSISHTKIIGPLINLFIRTQFFFWFVGLMMCDQLIRIVLGRFAGQHTTHRYLSLINVGDLRFFPQDNLQDTTKSRLLDSNYGKSNPDFKRPEYSLSIAHTLSVASKLAYEDVAVVKYELASAGYDVENTFKAIGYKNVCAYAVEKENAIMVVFRGTNPLNIQNYVTNIDAGLTKISSRAQGYMGKVHKGFWDAMGATESTESFPDSFDSHIQIDLSSASLSKSITSSMIGILRIIKMLSLNIFTNVIDPIDANWAGHDSAIVRHQSTYTQAEHHILQLIHGNKQKKLYVTGHSLGGALATVFVAKMIQVQSPLMQHFAGLYTFGQPNIGDKDFGKSFTPDINCKIFNHTYNNDVVPRIPFWYSSPPGTLVFIDSSYKISIYPPNQKTQDPIPVRPISYLHLSGLLNKSVIRRLRYESSIRILFRILFPFFINDHFPSDYSDALLKGDVEWVILGEEEGGNDSEQEEEQEKIQPMGSKRYSVHKTNEVKT
ncbi:class 3-domain-containing protein [Gilbertella persicaria]|uniref:class 3-domain-containing protein n=1 Tax=Gilbertella persicaria TaxID=101096 RepID=UPI00222079A5|nr:class 3-domain-containing protein [Gilbertella persicaria]KAI8082542.1 class 3-domain-containing protein [Gilbertella persicaria]